MEGEFKSFSFENIKALPKPKAKIVLDTEQGYNKLLDIEMLIFCDLFYPGKTFENVLVAFYTSDGTIKPHLLSTLGRSEVYQERGFVVNYESYTDNCDLLKEEKLSFPEYFSVTKDDDSGLNTFKIPLSNDQIKVVL